MKFRGICLGLLRISIVSLALGALLRVVSSETPLKDWQGVYAGSLGSNSYHTDVLHLHLAGEDSVYYHYNKIAHEPSLGGGINWEVIQPGSYKGWGLIEDRRLYIPLAHGSKKKREIRLSGSIEKYTMMTLNNHTVLMTNRALAY